MFYVISSFSEALGNAKKAARFPHRKKLFFLSNNRSSFFFLAIVWHQKKFSIGEKKDSEAGGSEAFVRILTRFVAFAIHYDERDGVQSVLISFSFSTSVPLARTV